MIIILLLVKGVGHYGATSAMSFKKKSAAPGKQTEPKSRGNSGIGRRLSRIGFRVPGSDRDQVVFGRRRKPNDCDAAY